MIIATAALIVTLFSGATPQAQDQSAPRDTAERQHGTAGLVITADVDGRVTIYDSTRRLVVELDKPARQQVQIALEPGTYEARLTGRDDRRARFEIREGSLQLLSSASFDAQPEEAVQSPAPNRHLKPRDGRHRIEVRFGAWADGLYDGHWDDWDYSGSAHGAFGLEYLNFIRNDIGIGFGVTGLVRADGCHDCFDHGTTQALTSILVTARWYPVRRFTPSRSVEPYVTAGVGPVFGVDTAYALDHEGRWHHDGYASTHVGTTFGGRVGGGVDFRLGRTFTMGLGGAWNWDAGFSDGLWRAPRPNGGEFTVSFGWNFGK